MIEKCLWNETPCSGCLCLHWIFEQKPETREGLKSLLSVQQQPLKRVSKCMKETQEAQQMFAVFKQRWHFCCSEKHKVSQNKNVLSPHSLLHSCCRMNEFRNTRSPACVECSQWMGQRSTTTWRLTYYHTIFSTDKWFSSYINHGQSTGINEGNWMC